MKGKNKHIESSLSGIHKENPFGAPEGYFDTLSERLNSRIQAEEKPAAKFQWFTMLKPILGLVASFGLIFLLLYVPLNTFLPRIWSNYNSKHPGIVTAQTRTQPGSNSYLETLMKYQLFTSSNDFQVLSTINDVENSIQKDSLTSQQIEDYIAMNYSDFDIIKSYNH